MIPVEAVRYFIDNLKLYNVLHVTEQNINNILSLLNYDYGILSGKVPEHFLQNIENSKKSLRYQLENNLREAKERYNTDFNIV